jgi:hypothetical protein
MICPNKKKMKMNELIFFVQNLILKNERNSNEASEFHGISKYYLEN